MSTPLLVITPYDPASSASIKESDNVEFTCPVNEALTGRYHEGDENGNTMYQSSSLKSATSALTAGATSTSGSIKESDDVAYTVPAGAVMTGRYHEGDENGDTQYQYTFMFFRDDSLTTGEAIWSEWMKESNSNFTTPDDMILIGRQHDGDENGKTRYQYAPLQLAGYPLKVTNRRWSTPIKESAGVWFSCPGSTVMTGRSHSGDENGETQYEYADVYVLIPGANQITTGDDVWSDWIKESDSTYEAPENKIITGRQHDGDENGNTRYRSSSVYYNGIALNVVNKTWGPAVKESESGWVIMPPGQVMTGRNHAGDENGDTQYQSGFLVLGQFSGEDKA